MAQAKLTGSPHFFLYTIPYIYIECTSQGLVVFDYNRVKDFKQASLSSSSSPSHRHLGIKLQAKKFTCNADEQRKWKIGAQLTMLPFTPLIFRPFNFPRERECQSISREQLGQVPTAKPDTKSFRSGAKQSKYLVNSIFSYDCPNAILVDIQYSRVATGHRGSK